jgi:hypothetical protein
MILIFSFVIAEHRLFVVVVEYVVMRRRKINIAIR